MRLAWIFLVLSVIVASALTQSTYNLPLRLRSGSGSKTSRVVSSKGGLNTRQYQVPILDNDYDNEYDEELNDGISNVPDAVDLVNDPDPDLDDVLNVTDKPLLDIIGILNDNNFELVEDDEIDVDNDVKNDDEETEEEDIADPGDYEYDEFLDNSGSDPSNNNTVLTPPQESIDVSNQTENAAESESIETSTISPQDMSSSSQMDSNNVSETTTIASVEVAESSSPFNISSAENITEENLSVNISLTQETSTSTTSTTIRPTTRQTTRRPSATASSQQKKKNRKRLQQILDGKKPINVHKINGRPVRTKRPIYLAPGQPLRVRKRKRRPAAFQNNRINFQNANRILQRKDCPKCKCGVSTVRRIVGGTTAQKNEFPWMALLKENGRILCGGSLISDRHVLTAAHCVRGTGNKRLTVELNEFNRASTTETVIVVRKVLRVFTLREYNVKTFNNDIAILRLSSPVSFANGTIRPICLPGTGKNYAGTVGVVSGWGAKFEGGDLTNVLHKVRVPIITNRQCKATGLTITNNMICAGRVSQGGVDACQGDSGGPLMVVQNRRYNLAGVVSWGEGCARPNAPGVYARVSQFRQWIKTKTLDACYCN